MIYTGYRIKLSETIACYLLHIFWRDHHNNHNIRDDKHITAPTQRAHTNHTFSFRLGESYLYWIRYPTQIAASHVWLRLLQLTTLYIYEINHCNNFDIYEMKRAHAQWLASDDKRRSCWVFLKATSGITVGVRAREGCTSVTGLSTQPAGNVIVTLPFSNRDPTTFSQIFLSSGTNNLQTYNVQHIYCIYWNIIKERNTGCNWENDWGIRFKQEM